MMAYMQLNLLAGLNGYKPGMHPSNKIYQYQVVVKLTIPRASIHLVGTFANLGTYHMFVITRAMKG